MSGELVSIGSPIILGMVSTTIMNLVDIAMVGRLGAAAIAAVGLGGILFYTLASFFNAMTVGVQVLTARRFGEDRLRETGLILQNALVIALLSGSVVTLVSIGFGPGLFPYLNGDPQVVRLGQGYLWYRFMGILFFTVNMAFHGFLNGVAQTRVHLRVTVLSNVLNVLLNYLLIFGKFGLPEMGVEGAGLASTISLLFSLLLYSRVIAGVRFGEYIPLVQVANLRWDLIRQLIRISLPVGVQEFLVHLGFSIFVVIIGILGTVELAASEIVFNILSFSFMPGYGLGMAAGTMVGKYLGSGQPSLATKSGWLSLRLATIFMGGVGLIFLVMPEPILRVFTTDPAVVREGVIALRMLGGIQFIDSWGLSISGALRGAGDTTYVSVVEICINLFCFLPATYLMAILWEWGLLGAWMAFGLYVFLFAAFMVNRFHGGRWKTIEV